MIILDDAVKVAKRYIIDHCDYDFTEEDQELLYQEMEQKDWIGDKRWAVKQMRGLIADITPQEIASHIARENDIASWTRAWQASAEMVLKQLLDNMNAQ